MTFNARFGTINIPSALSSTIYWRHRTEGKHKTQVPQYSVNALMASVSGSGCHDT